MELCYVTFPDRETCREAVDVAVEEGLGACAVMVDVDSVYRWQGAVEEEDAEVAALFKTTEENADALVARLAEMHPYDVPAIIRLPAGTTEAYADYLAEETR